MKTTHIVGIVIVAGVIIVACLHVFGVITIPGL